MFSPFVSKFVKGVLSAWFSDTRSLREQAGTLRESEIHFRTDHPDEALLLDGRCLAICFGLHGALGHARQRARDANTT